MKRKLLLLTILLGSLCTFQSCNKLEAGMDGQDGEGIVEISFEGVTFEKELDLSARAAGPYRNGTTFETNEQEQTVDIGNGMLLVANLSPADELLNNSDDAQIRLKDKSKAALITSTLPNLVRYRVAVFNQSGTLVENRVYTRGQESQANNIALPSGNYTFIAYSINTQTDPPNLTYNGTTGTLAAAKVDVDGNTDFMFFNRQLFVPAGTGANATRLNVVLTHRFSQVTAIFDSQGTGYKVTSVDGSFRPHSPTASIALQSGTITRSGQETASSLTFTETGNTQDTLGYSTIINTASTTAATYNINSITIGPLTLPESGGPALPTITGLRMTPGVRYNLRFTVIPTDSVITYNGVQVSRINGVIWANSNVDAVLQRTEPPTAIGVNDLGYYYQWGRGNTPVAAGTANNVTRSIWVRNNPSRTSWNGGTEIDPIKTYLDPCPLNYRIPTMREAQLLIDGTVSTNVNRSSSSSNYTSSKVMTSKRNASVQVILPAQGYFNVSGSAFSNYEPTSIVSRGAMGFYHTSWGQGNNLRALFFEADHPRISQSNNNLAFYSRSKVIRCVADIRTP
ncbi:hypothetical protein ACFSQ3_10205 [Sphingobacterium corticis]|uniref:Fibrobacter succinogenes major paralogous domain-containing protein n=1 Tax=Sphingobacterium corticis TaxID=1812823 RepID=A0ABW5NJL5_9SPHI